MRGRDCRELGLGKDAFDLGVRPGMTWTEISSPTRRAAAAPASVAAFTAPTSPAHEHGDIPGADVFLADEHDVGGLDHGIGGLDRADEAAGLHHSQRFAAMSAEL